MSLSAIICSPRRTEYLQKERHPHLSSPARTARRDDVHVLSGIYLCRHRHHPAQGLREYHGGAGDGGGSELLTMLDRAECHFSHHGALVMLPYSSSNTHPWLSVHAERHCRRVAGMGDLAAHQEGQVYPHSVLDDQLS